MAASAVVAGSNIRRLADRHNSSNPISKGHGQEQGEGGEHAVVNVPFEINDPKNASLTTPPKNTTTANAGPKGNDTSSNEEKIPKGSKNGTHVVPEKGQGAHNGTTPPVNSKPSSKETPDNGTRSSPPDKDVAPIKKKDDSVPDPEKDKTPDKAGEGKDKDRGKSSLYPSGCDVSHSCSDENKKLVACLRAAGNEMQELSILIENRGEVSLQVNITTPVFLKADSNLTLGKGKSITVQVTIIDQALRNITLSKIIIDGGNGNCSLDVPNQLLNAPYKQRFFEGFSYTAIITPMFGVYLLLFTVLAIGGSWMCCKLRRKRRHGDGIRYQELEMNLPESTLPITTGGKPEAENMDGWDEVWDDSWEDAEAARSSSRPMESLSSKGLASRKSNRDGWDNSWDD